VSSLSVELGLRIAKGLNSTGTVFLQQTLSRGTAMSDSASSAISFDYDNRVLAETYDRLSDLQFDAGKELVAQLELAGSARVLDVGCGTGRLAGWIARTLGPSAEVMGIDPLPERVGIAQLRIRNASFRVGQAEDLSAYAGENLDAVVMSSVFHWVNDKPKALAEVRRVLRVGGKLGITTASRELSQRGSLGSTIHAVLERAPYAGRFGRADMSLARPDMTTTDLVNVVLESGLELDTLRIVPRSWQRNSGEELVEFLESSSFGNFLRIAPEELRRPLRADLIEAFEARRGPHGIVLRDWFTLVVARRAER
jgi:ubiquinone/menaquinone biosynthesis C-methylase UbiE